MINGRDSKGEQKEDSKSTPLVTATTQPKIYEEKEKKHVTTTIDPARLAGQYKVVMDRTVLDRISDYKNALESRPPSAKAGLNFSTKLAEKLAKKRKNNQGESLDLGEFIQALMDTKKPRIFAEFEIRGNGTDWTQQEIALLGDI